MTSQQTTSPSEGASQQYAVAPYNPSDYYRQFVPTTGRHTAYSGHNIVPNVGQPSSGSCQTSWTQCYPQQRLPPPPPGPPPSALLRMHSVVKEIVVPPPSDCGSFSGSSYGVTAPLFRQAARTPAPLPLRNRGLAAAPLKLAEMLHESESGTPFINAQPTKTPRSGRSMKPAPIDVRLAEGVRSKQEHFGVKTAPMRRAPMLPPLSAIGAARKETVARCTEYPKTAGISQTWRNDTDPESQSRCPRLSPLKTQMTPDSHASVLVNLALSPSLIPLVTGSLCPTPPARVSSTPSPLSWSPKTPRAMFFDNVTVHSDTTPPMPDVEWLNDRPQTIIEEEIQDTTPLDADPPRGRIGGKQIRVAKSRARSLSPPTSAYPKESAFSWDVADFNYRSATDDDLYCLTPVYAPQMIETDKYKPVIDGFDIRQTILGSYFGH